MFRTVRTVRTVNARTERSKRSILEIEKSPPFRGDVSFLKRSFAYLSTRHGRIEIERSKLSILPRQNIQRFDLLLEWASSAGCINQKLCGMGWQITEPILSISAGSVANLQYLFGNANKTRNNRWLQI